MTSSSSTQANELDGLLSVFVVHGKDICSLVELCPRTTVGEMKTYYLNLMRSTPNRAEEYLPADASAVRFYCVQQGVAVGGPLADDKPLDSLDIPFFPEEADAHDAPLWPAEMLLATFALPDGSWEPAVFPAMPVELMEIQFPTVPQTANTEANNKQ